MTTLMKGAPAAAKIRDELGERVGALRARGVSPCLGLIRVGARPDDLAYERGAKKRMESVGVDCRVFELPEDVTQDSLEEKFAQVNSDPEVHGIMVFRPLPKGLDIEPLRSAIDPRKDVDCMSPANIAGVFAGDKDVFAPCTPEAVLEVLDFYNVPLSGKRVTVVGRSLVVGRPLAMLLVSRNATVTVCHTRTADLAAECRRAEILIAAAGRAKMIGPELVADGAVVVDVGINVGPDGKLCGDVDFDAVSEAASAITPVPGGVGAVTSSVLARHVVRAAELLTR